MIQIRYGGAKGILVLNPELKSEFCLIYFRESMIKYHNDSKDNILELIDYNKFRGGYLNRQIIILLLTNGVRPDNIYKLYLQYVSSLESKVNLNSGIYKHFNQDYDGTLQNLRPIDEIVRQMINAKVSVEDDPFITGILKTFRAKGYQQLKEKCNILVDKSARLMGYINK